MLRAVRCTAWLGLAVSFGQDQEQETEPNRKPVGSQQWWALLRPVEASTPAPPLATAP